MVRLVSNNDTADKIIQFKVAQVGLNAEENALILLQTPKDQFVKSSARYEMIAEQSLVISDDAFPNLKKFMQGPFSMQVYNRGDDLAHSLLCFDIELATPKTAKIENGIIVEDPMNMTARSLAVIPFVDVFTQQIEKEAELADRLIRKSKDGFRHNAAQKDQATVNMLMDAFKRNLNADEVVKNRLVGLESISDNLAASLNASTVFYDQLWQGLQKAYEPALRKLGEDCALGRIHIDGINQQPINIVFE